MNIIQLADEKKSAPPDRTWTEPSKGRSSPNAGYSRLVGWLKVILPVAAVAIVISMFAYSALLDFGENTTFTVSEIERSGNELKMSQPRLTFLDKKEQEFVVTAATATQIGDRPNVWFLNSIVADMKPVDGGWMQLLSTEGELDSDAELMDLSGVIQVYTHDGYEMHATTANVNFGTGAVISKTPVQGKGPRAKLSAESMEIDESGDILHFEGNVRLTIEPEDEQKKS